MLIEIKAFTLCHLINFYCFKIFTHIFSQIFKTTKFDVFLSVVVRGGGRKGVFIVKFNMKTLV